MTKEGSRKTGSYSGKRLRYFEAVITMSMAGMSSTEIACVIPVGRSSVLRWVDEYKAGLGDSEILFDVSKSPQTASSVLDRMRQYVENPGSDDPLDQVELTPEAKISLTLLPNIKMTPVD